jgi:hypothetical protein
VIQTVLAAQMVSRGGMLDPVRPESNGAGAVEKISTPTSPRMPKPEEDPSLRKW